MITLGSLTRSVVASAFVVLFMVLIIPAPAAAQQAIIEGTVTSALTGQPLPGANVMIRGTTIGTATNLDGFYRMTLPLAQVTGEEETLVATFVGYRSRTATLTLTAVTQTVNFELAEDVLGFEDVVVTGVVGATFKERLPFTVDIVSRSALEQVPMVSIDQALRGKVSGVSIVKGSGQPGDVSSIRLRGASSITGTQDPLYIVDGVILAGSLVDIDALDLESVEVIKGAAAASLYGARAANGVIHFRTRRGAGLAQGQTNVTFRSEWGFTGLERAVPRNMSHYYKVDDPNNPGRYVDADGNTVERNYYSNVETRVIDRWPEASNIYFADKPYPAGTKLYNHVDDFFNPGISSMNTISISGRTANTNFLVSLHNTIEPGIIRWDRSWTGLDPMTGQTISAQRTGALDGLTRRNFRANLDHRLSDQLTLAISTAYSNSVRDTYPGGMFGLLLIPSDVDLLAPNDDGQAYRVKPAPDVTEQSNPLYEIAFAENLQKRQRFISNVGLRYQPLEWLALEGNFSYDRGDNDNESFYDKGFKTLLPSLLNDGEYFRGNSFYFAINSSFDVNITRNFGLLNTNTRLRYLTELQDSEGNSTTGRVFTVPGIRSFANIDTERTLISSGISRVRSEGFYFITGLDYDGRYILDFLVRRDGSSLFGPDDRWHTYYRASGAYRLAQEDWWTFDPINEFKLRYSIGTAGGRPVFNAQYETWSFAAGSVVKRTLGNKELRPEVSTEQEFGVEIGLLDRFLLDFVYATTVTDDALMLVPLSGIFGYSHRWENGGTIESKTFEASLRAFALQKRDIRLSFNLNFDMTDIVITKMNVPDYTWGPQLQNANVFINREGEKFGTYYGTLWAGNLNQLLPRGVTAAEFNQFDINDDGYVVWVGEGNTYQDGIAKRLWGTSGTVGGSTYAWGMPISFIDEDGNNQHPLGRAVPDFSLSFGTNFQYKNLQVYALLDSEIGHKIYNMQKQWPWRDSPTHGDLDQAGKPDGQKKPFAYYQGLYNIAAPNSHFAEDGDYVKLRELSVRYRFDRAQLRPIFGGWVNQITIGIVGRNLLTWTKYTGFDPEIGVVAGNSGFGTYGYAPQQSGATIVRFDGTQAYPNYRMYSFVFELQF